MTTSPKGAMSRLSGWSIRAVADFCSRSRHINVDGSDLPPLSVTKGRGVILQSDKYNKRIATDSRKYVIARAGQFAFDPMSLYYGAIGRVGVESGLISPDYVVFDADGTVDPVFLNYLLRAPHQVQAYERVAETGNQFGKRRRVYWSVFEQLEFSLPPYAEQQKIAAILSSVDEVIEKTEGVIEQLQIVKKAMMQELLTRGLPGRHTRFRQTEIGEVPEEWDVNSLGSVGRWLSGGTPSKQDSTLWTGELPWVSPKDMKKQRIDDAIDHVAIAAVGKGTQLAPVGSLLMVVRGMILAHTFPVALTIAPVTFNQDIKALVVDDRFDAEFLLYWLELRGPELLKLADVANHGTKRMPSELLFASPVARPPLEEQRALVATLRAFDARREAESAYLKRARATRSAIRSVLLTGELRVTPDEGAK